MAATITPTRVAVSRSDLARALRAAASIKAKGLRLRLDAEQVTVNAYSHDVAVEVALDVPGQSGAGETYVQRTTLAALLPYCDAELSLGVVNGKLEVTSGETACVLPAAAKDIANTYGHPFDDMDPDALTLEAPVLVEALRRTLPFASRDMTRPILCTVALYPASGMAVATDSYRLTVVRWGDDDPAEIPILLTVEGADSMRKLLGKQLGTVAIDPGEKHILTRFDDITWSLRALPGYQGEPPKYPKWRNLLPDADTQATLKVDREDLLAATRCAAALTAGHQPLHLIVAKDSASVAVKSSPDRPSMSRRLISAEVTGGDVEMGLNPKFASDICAVAPVERLTAHIIGPLRPLLVEAARDLYLLMPVRLTV